ncbi:MAG TPA: hypothetical protein PLO37_24145 [Candidatus Hydrogenedentes bacterium]|nr:hypothetical protein [Candidatus Hydrogenedentota bacterium]HPG69955.1 hypothetical protein [Candidatus Hydrogenedentota bacterium]
MKSTQRPYIGVLFKCCNVYARVHLNKDGTAYAGFCPKCAKKLTIPVAPGGSPSRFWTAE